MISFTKLFSSIITSSIWNEDDKTRIVWITILALADSRGRVWASTGGLAHSARTSLEDTKAAIDKLMSPDPDSRTETDEGRRIAKIDGGFQVINHSKYRELRDDDVRNDYMREYMRKRRTENVNNVNPVSDLLTSVNSCKPPLAKAEAEAEAEADIYISPERSHPATDSAPTPKKKTTHPPDELFLAELKRHYPDVDVDSELRKMDAWLMTKPGKQKTRRFVVNWLNRTDPGVKPQPQEQRFDIIKPKTPPIRL
jgi:hypothetical protein